MLAPLDDVGASARERLKAAAEDFLMDLVQSQLELSINTLLRRTR